MLQIKKFIDGIVIDDIVDLIDIDGNIDLKVIRNIIDDIINQIFING